MTPVIPALKLSEHFTIDESVYSDKAIELGLIIILPVMFCG